MQRLGMDFDFTGRHQFGTGFWLWCGKQTTRDKEWRVRDWQFQVRDNGGLEQSGRNGSGKQQSDSGQIFKEVLAKCVDGLDVCKVRERSHD